MLHMMINSKVSNYIGTYVQSLLAAVLSAFTAIVNKYPVVTGCTYLLPERTLGLGSDYRLAYSNIEINTYINTCD